MNSDKLPALNKLLQQNNLDAVPMIQPPADPLCVPWSGQNWRLCSSSRRRDYFNKAAQPWAGFVACRLPSYWDL